MKLINLAMWCESATAQEEIVDKRGNVMSPVKQKTN